MMATMRIRPGAEADDEALPQFCQRHHITRLALCGSSLRSDFTASSDIDVLAGFGPSHVPGLLLPPEMKIGLGRLPGGARPGSERMRT